MPAPQPGTSARAAIDEFTRHLAEQGFANSTRRIRKHFLDEYLHHALQVADLADVTAGELMEPARVTAWLVDAIAHVAGAPCCPGGGAPP